MVDEEILKTSKVNITPLYYDLTDHNYFDDLARWELFKSE